MALRARTADAGDDGEHAIIDIGSNTVRLVIYDGPVRAPAVLYNEKVTARLGKGVAEDGRLAEKGMAAALSSLGRFAAILRLRGITDVQTVATAAVRDATNGDEFLERVAQLGLSPRLLSGEEEALASARGIMAAFPGASGAVGDLGGGSLELTDIDGESCTHGTSLPLGTLRLPALRADGPVRFARRVQKMMEAVDWSGQHNQPFYLVGGSWRALARVAMVRQGWPIDDPHGFELSPEDALKISRNVAMVPPAEPKGGAGRGGTRIASERAQRHLGIDGQALGIPASRLAGLPDAAALLGVLVRELKPSKLVFSGWGLREGLLAARFDRATLAQDPMLAGIGAFVEAQVPGLALTAAMVARWTAQVTPALNPVLAADSGGAGGNSGEPLRLAATMLALASMRTEPNLRGELAAKWALRKRWIGLDAEGRAMIALAVLANSGHTAIPPELLQLAPISRLREGMAWGLATRLARRFTGTATQALEHSSLLVVGGRLVLSVRSDMAALYSEVVEKDLRVLAECLGLQPQFQAISAEVVLP